MKKFIAYKRTKCSNYQYAEFSKKMSETVDAIAPDAGNYEKIILIDEKEYTKLKNRMESVEKELGRCRKFNK
jgi:hypothetical protein